MIVIYKISPAEGSTTKLSRGRDMEGKVWLWLHLYKHPTLSRWILVTQRSMCDVLCEWRQVWLRWFFSGDEGESSVGLKDTQQKRCKSLQGCSADGLAKGRPFLSSKTEGREREDKGHRFIHLSRCGYVFLHTFVHETDMKCLCLVNKSCIWVSAIAFRSPPSVVSAHSRLRRFLDHLLSEWISTKHQMKVGQVALIGQRGEGVLHYTGFFFTVINIFRALHQRTNWFNAQLRVGPWLERGHSVDFKRPLASEWSFHGSQLCYASPVHFNSFDLHSWWIN